MRALAALALGLAACSDPSLSISLVYDDALGGYLTPTDGSPPPAVSVRVRAVDPARAGQARWRDDPDDTAPVTCDEVERAKVPEDVLDTATVASARDGRPLTGVPRLGDKLLVAEVLRGDRVDGRGCELVGDIEDDLSPIIHVDATVRLVARVPPGGGDDQVDVLLFLPWEDTPVTGESLELVLERFDRDGAAAPRTIGAATGVARIDGLVADALPGPVHAVIGLPGAMAPLRLVRWQPLLEQAVLPLDLLPGTRASWTVGLVNYQGSPFPQPQWTAVAAHLDATGAHRLTGLRREGNGFRVGELAAGEAVAGAPVIAGGNIWLITAAGWQAVTNQGLEPPSPADAGAAATEVYRLPPCGSLDLRFLVRREPGTPYQLYSEERVRLRMLEGLGPRSFRGTLCLSRGASLLELMVVADPDGRLALVREGGPLDVTLDTVTAFDGFELAFEQGVARHAIAAQLTQTGPRVRSFRLPDVDNGTPARVLVPTAFIDAPLATSPRTLRAVDLDPDPTVRRNDVVAVIPGDPGLRLQAVVDVRAAGERLSAFSPRLPVGTTSTGDAHLVIDDIGGDGQGELIILTDDGLVIY